MPFPIPSSASTAITYGTVADLEVRLGRTLTGADIDRAQAALDDASAAILACVTTVPDPTPAAVTSVALAAALRLFTNPDGYTSETLGSYSYRRDNAGGLLTDAECELVRRACRTGAAGVGTVRLVTSWHAYDDEDESA